MDPLIRFLCHHYGKCTVTKKQTGRTNVRFQKDYKDCCVLAFTETRFTELAIDGFGATLRLDRDPEPTGKYQGGGVCVYINKTHYTSMTIRDHICTPDI